MYASLPRWPSFGLFVLLSLLAACGGSSEGAVDFRGVWTGNLTLLSGTETTPMTCLIFKGMYCYPQSDGTLYTLPAVTGTASPFHTDGSESFPVNVSGSSLVSAFAITGQGIGDSSAISGQFEVPFPDNTTDIEPFDLHPYQAVKGAVTLQSGQWEGVDPNTDQGPLSFSISMAPDGSFHGPFLLGCTLTGSLFPVVGQSNLFAVDMTIIGPGGVPSDHCGVDLKGRVTETGLAYESDTDDFGWFNNAPGPYYYMIVTGPDSLLGGTHALLLIFRAQ